MWGPLGVGWYMGKVVGAVFQDLTKEWRGQKMAESPSAPFCGHVGRHRHSPQGKHSPRVWMWSSVTLLPAVLSRCFGFWRRVTEKEKPPLPLWGLQARGSHLCSMVPVSSGRGW
ncbi:hypothetical protein GDO78_021918 [Eleutherodactylus coqui]|uniref:Uncharacterized protein n=1 Tax=Eleutherodactylus coqui TaxID=57060 RepID=A0A8J6EGJ9_ELECQ|nr:hypothetical protein GDO78_021918 [Eleutherodactylus coqui]